MAEVVQLTFEGPIAVVALEERERRNTFTAALVTGLTDAFAKLAAMDELAAVVIHGHDSVFCAGGTQEELLAIADKRLAHADGGFYRLLLDCPVPVIAAMQGHALGGGLAFGLFADMVVLSRESLYGANFMKYGFTPGMGATYIIPERFGAALGQEMLLTANLYHGGELARRGVGYPVEPRAQVIPAAMKLARDLADKPPLSLRLLKKHLTRATAAVLPEIVRLEQEMHDRSFAQPGVRDRILTRFGDS